MSRKIAIGKGYTFDLCEFILFSKKPRILSSDVAPGLPRHEIKELVHRRDTTKTRFLGSQFYSYRIQLFHSGITYIMVSDFQKKIDIHNSNIFTIFLCGAASGCDQCDQWCDQWHWRSQLVAPVSFLAPDFGRIITSSFKKKVNPHRKTIVDISSHQGFLLTRSDLRNICREKNSFFFPVYVTAMY